MYGITPEVFDVTTYILLWIFTSIEAVVNNGLRIIVTGSK